MADVLTIDDAGPLRVIVCCESRELRGVLEATLAATAGLHVVALAESAEELSLAAVQRCEAHVLLLDISPSPELTIRVVRKLRAGCPALRIIVIDVVQTGSTLVALLHAGASALMPRCAGVEAILHTTNAVLVGATVIPQGLTASLASVLTAPVRDYIGGRGLALEGLLTLREYEIAALLVEGLSNKAIADRLNVAPCTVKSHVHNILQKLGLQTRAQIARYFLVRHVLVQPTRRRSVAEGHQLVVAEWPQHTATSSGPSGRPNGSGTS